MPIRLIELDRPFRRWT